MNIKDLLGEDATAVIKDYKPGQMVSIMDPATDTLTTVDLKKNPMALKPNDQGQLVYDPTPNNAAGAPGTGEKPPQEIKPGAQIAIDTSTQEERDEEPDRHSELYQLQATLWDLYKDVTGFRPRQGTVDWTKEQWNDPEFLKSTIDKLVQHLDESKSHKADLDAMLTIAGLR